MLYEIAIVAQITADNLTIDTLKQPTSDNVHHCSVPRIICYLPDHYLQVVY